MSSVEAAGATRLSLHGVTNHDDLPSVRARFSTTTAIEAAALSPAFGWAIVYDVLE